LVRISPVDPRLRPSYTRLLSTYAALVGVPALALFVILRAGDARMMLFGTLTLMPLSRVARRFARLVGRDRS